MTVLAAPPRDRFAAKVDISADPDGCWPWTGARDRQGYGVFGVPGNKTMRAHRWLLGYLRGSPLRWDDQVQEMALHRCDNPPCVNPRHLYIGDGAANQTDAVDRGRHHNARKTYCKNGHEYTAETTRIVPSTGHRQCRICERESQSRLLIRCRAAART